MCICFVKWQLSTCPEGFMSLSSLSKLENRVLPNGPSMVEGWVVHVTFVWSVYHVDSELLADHRSSLPKWQSSWGQHGAHLGPVGPSWAPCWPHEPCYQGLHTVHSLNGKKYFGNSLVTKQTNMGATMGCPFHSWVTFGDLLQTALHC